VTENYTYGRSPVAERKALTLLRDIVQKNSRSLALDGDRLVVTRPDGKRYFVEVRSSKVYNESGKFICLSVLSPGLPVIDQVIAKSLYLLTSEPWANLDHDLLYKVTIAGLDPSTEWPWVKSFSYASLGDSFSNLIGADFAVKGIKVSGLAIKLQLWYVNYCSRFESIRMKHLRGSMGAVVLCNDDSQPPNAAIFQTCIDELRSCNERRLPMIFVGLYDETTNMDARNSTGIRVGEEVAGRNNIPFFACSVSHPATTAKPLAYLTEMILKRQPSRRKVSS
jgi:hypothetical protein